VGTQNPARQVDPDVRARVDDMLAEIRWSLPGPWTYDSFTEWLSRRRGHPVELRPMREKFGDDAPCGWTIICDDRDIVYYPSTATGFRGRFIAYHEFAHLLFGHSNSEDDHRELAHELAPDIDPAMIRQVLGRTDYDRREEQEAELLAMHLLRNDVAHLGVRSKDPRVATRVGRALRLIRGRL
jgi:hypothetical protein